MKSFEQLAREAYRAYLKVYDHNRGFVQPEWDALDQRTRESWIAATKQLWAEFAAMH